MDGDVAIDAGTDNDASFRVSFLLPGSSFQTPAGTVLLQVRGCSNAGSGGSTCYGTTKNPGVDAKSDVRANVGLLKALAAPPQSTLTAGGSLSAPGVTVRAANRDNPTGLVLHVGSAITIDVGTSVLQGPPGSSGANTKLEGDAVLAKLKTDDRFFESLFGMERALFKRLPGALSIPCAAGCKLSDLDARNWLTTYAGKVVYVDGDLTIDESGAVPATIGSNSRPAMLVVNGKLTIAAPIELIGFFYGNSIDWTGTAAGASVRGALISANDVTADATMTLTYDSALLEAIRLGYGSYVRVPGGWNRGGI